MIERSVPFLSRKQLQFKHGADFTIRVVIHSQIASDFLLVGMTKDAPFKHTITHSGDGTKLETKIRLPDIPILISLTVADTSIDRGEAYAQMILQIKGMDVMSMSTGYVSNAESLAWPRGKHEGNLDGRGKEFLITGTTPAVGDDVSETVPNNVVWRLKTLIIKFVADANVATRTILIFITDGTNELTRTFVDMDITASETAFLYFKDTAFPRVLDKSPVTFSDLPSNILFKPGYKLQTSTAQKQVGDQYSNIFYQVEQWIVPE